MTLTKCMIDNIADAMINCQRADRGQTKLVKGYTYIGQLISHDIVKPSTPSVEKRKQRKITGNLDLQSIYGDHDDLNQTPNNKYFDEKGKFKFCESRGWDFQRIDGIAQIPEIRNDQNVIIAQFHMLWQKLHNHLIESNIARNAQESKEFVVKTFQLVVLEDYLEKILNKDVFEFLIKHNGNLINEDNPQWENIFQFSSFKFGHSTVRSNYQLSKSISRDCNTWKDINDLILLSRKSDRKIHKEERIDWQLFFSDGKIDDQHFEGTKPIDTIIDSGMDAIPNENPSINNRNLARHIVKVNIKAEQNSNIPNWQEIIETINEQVDANGTRKFRVKALSNNDFKKATYSCVSNLELQDITYWMYMLLEAQVSYDLKNRFRLGLSASIINGAIIKKSIKKASISVFADANSSYCFETACGGMGDWGEKLKSMVNDNHDKKHLMKNIVDFLAKKKRGKYECI